MKIQKFFVIVVLFLLPLYGCGKEGASASSGTTITITPASVSKTDTNESVSWNTDTYLTIQAKDSGGNPLNKVRLIITYNFTSAPPGAGVIRLWDGSTSVNVPFEAVTDEFGVYNLRLDYQSGGGLKYTGALEVRSGAAYATATFSIS